MYYRIIPILVTLAVIIIGFIARVINAGNISKRREFTISFQNSFIELANGFFKTGRMPNDLYSKCIHDVDAMSVIGLMAVSIVRKLRIWLQSLLSCLNRFLMLVRNVFRLWRWSI